jgi:uncharacterized protein YbjT (DUF2867 family)
MRKSLRIAVVGATGYVGGRLVPTLLAAGHSVVAIGRGARKLAARPYATHPNLHPAAADVMDKNQLREALRSQGPIDAAYWLAHSMRASSSSGDFASADRLAAQNMVWAAEHNSIPRIVYLGGLGEESPDLSHHLASRIEVGRILGQGPARLTWLRAAMILGSGSASFELMRYLVERLPVMIAPRWVYTRCQPIAISDAIRYLVRVLDAEETAGQSFDIGGPDILSYADLFRLYAEEAGLRPRLIIPVPLLTPTLSSLWIHLVTPVPAGLARPLTEGLRNEVICRESRIRELFPEIGDKLLSCREAISLALKHTRARLVESCWSDAGGEAPPEWLRRGDAGYSGGTLYDAVFSLRAQAAPEELWPVIAGLGGEDGWFFGNWLWRLRGMLDRLFGGVGLARGRRADESLRVGDALDFWRVVELAPNRRLTLLAEMRLPGEAALQFTLTPEPDAGKEKPITRLTLAARFAPRGLAGVAYWRLLQPAHGYLFKGLLRTLARRAGRVTLEDPHRLLDEDAVCRLD